MKCNPKIVDCLNVTLNLNDGTYCLFHKSYDETTYTHVQSDHPCINDQQNPKID